MIVVTQLIDDDSADYVFEVDLSLPGRLYKVTCSEEYYQKLTNRKIDAAELVRRSFAFLLEHEPPEAIMQEFDLPLIGRYFPAYEQTIISS